MGRGQPQQQRRGHGCAAGRAGGRPRAAPGVARRGAGATGGTERQEDGAAQQAGQVRPTADVAAGDRVREGAHDSN